MVPVVPPLYNFRVRSRIFRAREAIDEQLRPLLDTDSATRERARS